MRVRITLTYRVARWLPINDTPCTAKLSSELFNITVIAIQMLYQQVIMAALQKVVWKATICTRISSHPLWDVLTRCDLPPWIDWTWRRKKWRRGNEVTDVELWIIKWKVKCWYILQRVITGGERSIPWSAVVCCLVWAGGGVWGWRGVRAHL